MTNLKQKRFVDTDYLKEQLDSTSVEVEGSYISATETKIGYTTDIEIHGNTVQDASNLADIRSVGDKVEGQELYEIPVLSRGKNLNSGFELGGIDTTSSNLGNPTPDTNFIRSKFFILINGSNKITVSTDKPLSSANMVMCSYNNNMEALGYEVVYSASKAVFTPKPNTKYIRIRLQTNDLTTKVQIEEGTVVTEYEPYQEDKLTILSPTPLEKVRDVADRIICKDGVWGVEKNIKTKNINTNIFSKRDLNNENYARWCKPNSGEFMDCVFNSEINGYCDKYEVVTDLDSQRVEKLSVCLLGGTDDYRIMLITPSEIGNVAKLNDYVSSNPFLVKYPTTQPTFIPLPHDQQIKLRTFANKTNISFLTEVEGYIKCKVPKSVGGTLESLVEKAKMTDDRLELLENVSEGNNMKYSTDTGIIHCKDTKKGRVNDLAIEGNTMVNYCRDGSKTLTLNGDINEVGTYITTENAVNNGKVDVMCEGNTLVNKLYKIKNYGSSTEFEKHGWSSEVGNCNNYEWLDNGIKIYSTLEDASVDKYYRSTPGQNGIFRKNRTYVVRMNVNSNDLQQNASILRCFYGNAQTFITGEMTDVVNGVFIKKGTTSSEIEEVDAIHSMISLDYRPLGEGSIEGWVSFQNVMVIDVTDLPIHQQDVEYWRNVEYFEGMKSVGQDDENEHNIEILSKNKNLFNPEEVYESAYSYGVPCVNSVKCQEEDGVFTTVTPANSWNVGIGFHVKTEKNKDYTLSVGEYFNDGVNMELRCIGVYKSEYPFKSNNNIQSYVTRTGCKDLDSNNNSLTYNSKDYDYILFYIGGKWNENSNEVKTFRMSKIEVNQSSTKPTNYTKQNLNKKEILLNEPLRGLPNGVKDRIVKMNNKWYVERNCGEVVLNGSENWLYPERQDGDNTILFYSRISNAKINQNYPICDKFNGTYLNIWEATTDIEGVVINHNKDCILRLNKSKLSSQDVQGLKQWLQTNNVTVVYQLDTPLYEELTVEPTLTTYVDKTHISTNSVIPCDMKVKNSGYSTIIKPSTLYTVALDTSKSGEVKVNLGGAEKTTTNNIVTITTPSTLVDDSLRISGKGLTSKNVRIFEDNKTNYIPPYFEGLKSSFEEKQGDNHIVEVISNNKNLIEWEDLSLYTPQKNAKVEKTTEGIRAYNRVTGDDRVFLQPFRVRQGSKVTISFDVKVDTEGSSTLFYLSFLDANFNAIANNLCFPTKIYTTSFERLTKTFDVGNASYIRIELVCFGTSTGATYKNIMVTESSSSYTPHKSSKIQFSTLAPLRSVGDVSDKLVYKDNKWMIERNIGIINFKDLGTWYIAGDNGYRADIRRGLGKFITDKPNLAIFSAYASTSSSWDKPYMGRIFHHATQGEIIVTRPTGTTLEEFHKSIQENEEFCLYVLREPYYEEIGEYRNLDSYDEETTIYANTFIAPKNLSFNLAAHMSNIVKDVQDDVSDLKTWRSEVFDSITHKKTFDSGFTTIEDTKEGVIEDVKLEGKTLVNLAPKYSIKWTHSGTWLSTFLIGTKNPVTNDHYKVVQDLKPNTEYTIVVNIKTNTQSGNVFLHNPNVNTCVFTDTIHIKPSDIGVKTFKVKTVESFDHINSSDMVVLRTQSSGIASGETLIEDIMILEGDYTQNPPSYFEGLKSVGQDVDEIVVSSVKGDGNLFDKDNVNKLSNMWLGCKVDVGNGTGVIQEDTYESLYWIRIEPSTTYTIQKMPSYRGRCGFSKNKPALGVQVRAVTSDVGTFPMKVTSMGDENYLLISGYCDNNYDKNITEEELLSSIQINKGATLKQYTPHQSDKKRLLYYNTETQTWEKPILREWDSIEKHLDGKYYYHQRSAEVVLNGSEDWIRGMELTNTTKYETLDFNNKIKPYNSINDIQPLCCDKFIVTSDYINNNIDCESIGQTVSPYNTISIRISNTKLSSNNVEGFKQWLQANNVTVVYQLAEEKVYECTNIELNSYDEETNVIVDSGAISPITTVSLTSNLPQVAENLKNRVRQLEAELYNYKVNQNLRQLRTSYRSDYANFGVATINNYSIEPTSIAITPYGYDLFEIFKEVIAQGKDKYDRIELEEYIDFYLMTFVFDFDMVFELFDLLDANEDTIEDEPVEEEPPTEEEEDVVEDTPTILPNLPGDEATPIPLI